MQPKRYKRNIYVSSKVPISFSLDCFPQKTGSCFCVFRMNRTIQSSSILSPSSLTFLS
ncbi:hypothetical protein X975_05749, partial [Stegodyphus mimosarum]